MSEEWKHLIAAAVITLTQLYVMEPWKFPIFAKIWDVLATVSGYLANYLAKYSMQARLNYYTAVSASGD